MKQIKVRFAPSPTGPLHIGGARSALFNYLFARKQRGKMLLRIEDTDLERSSPEFEREIIDSLSWLGINWDEGIDVGGDNGPYRQTERLDTYQRYVDQLLRSGHAYHCFCTEEELARERQALLEKGEIVAYSGKCRHLDPEERQRKLRQGLVPTVRFKVVSGQEVVVNDLVRGTVTFNSSEIGDFIIVKSDGIPTYNFAVVVDDHEMGVTHVIRAEEHLSNTPRQLLIYQTLGFEIPEFAHISLILGKDRQKMSKRHGATSIMQYRESGYLPEAVFNFLALLGWSPEGEQEILGRDEIVKQFSLSRVAKNPAVFDLDKLNWLNAQHIKRKAIMELGEMLKPYLKSSPFWHSVEQMDQATYEVLIEAVRDRIVRLVDVVKEVEPFFIRPQYEADTLDRLEQPEVRGMLQGLLEHLPDELDLEEARSFMKGLPKALQLPAKQVYMPIRLALTGSPQGPELPYLLVVMGVPEVRRRITGLI
ncbi:MAG: glutamate--tRNA ligase [Syntrophomonadaceae bacterium]|nr:glutamate--tRNA ligase [Syntrophomonadaceae bacterium]